MKVVIVAGLKVHSLTKADVLAEIKTRISKSDKTTAITPYSEFLLAALREREFMELLNRATLSLPDGIGVLWAEKFLSVPLTVQGYYRKIVQAIWQMIWTGAAIILHPSSLYQVFPEKLVGADLFWDILAMAQEENFSVYLLGGEHDIPDRAEKLLHNRFPKLRILGRTNKIWNDPTLVSDINAVSPDMTLVFFPYRRQERWIFENIDSLNTKFIIGLGGTLDYAVGEKIQPPRWIRSAGLEWLFRLITQPSRIGRIWNAFVGLITALIRLKVFNSMPFRTNVVAVIQHTDSEILICQRNPQGSAYGSSGGQKLTDYWQLPQGGINLQEDLVAGARREALEEVGLNELEFIKIHENAFEYLWRNAVRRLWFNSLQFSGQRQNLVYFSYAGSKNEVKLDNKEFTDFKWVKLEQLPAMLHPERSVIAEIIVSDLQKSS